MFNDFDRLSITAGVLAFFIYMLRFSIKLAIEWYIRRRDRRLTPMRLPSLDIKMDNESCFSLNKLIKNLTNETFDFETITEKTIFGTLYSLIWLAAVISNGLVIAVLLTTYIIGRQRRRKCVISESSFRRRRAADRRDRIFSMLNPHPFTVQTIFVISLACSDLLSAMTSLPITAISIFSREWLFPSFMCPLISFLQAFSIFQSSFTFTSIAIDRYILVLYPKAKVLTYRSARASVAATAILSAVLALPMYLYVNLEEMKLFCVQVCNEQWPENNQLFTGRNYSLFTAIVQFGLPIVATSICYFSIARDLKKRQNALQLDKHLKKRRGAEPDLSTTSYCTTPVSQDLSTSVLGNAKRFPKSPVESRLTRRRRRTVRMMAAMVAAFTIFWFPYTIVSITQEFDLDEGLIDYHTSRLLFTGGHLIAMSTLVWNPIIYAWYNRRIRAVLKAFLGALGCRCFGRLQM